MDGHEERVALRARGAREIDERSFLAVGNPAAEVVARNSDDANGRVVRGCRRIGYESQRLADSALVGPKAGCGGLTDDDHGCAGSRFIGGKVAAEDDGQIE